MKRAAIYARFSTDKQNENSCQDQINLCKQTAEKNGWHVVSTYKDEAISGASVINRLGLAQLILDAKNKKFDILICEALDRLSRDQADLAQIKKELTFFGVTIHTIQDGEVGTIHIGIKGLLGELYLADLAQKTKRGQTAVVNDGRHAGGKSFGYDNDPIQKGVLSINKAEAEIVKRIFNKYVSGLTPRQIAAELNAQGIKSPRGGKWNASTINGSAKRHNGILQNRLYIGQIVWNRHKYIKDPATGKRVSRLNPEEEWIKKEAPELRIVSDALFQQVAQIKKQKGSKHSYHSKKPKHLLSGLTKCGCCGASYTVQSAGRISCAGFKERHDCFNNRTISRKHVEERVLEALKKYLAQPELIAAYVKEYQAESRRLMQAEYASLASKQQRLNQIKKDIDHNVEIVIAGNFPDSVLDKIRAMEVEQKQLQAEIEYLKKEQPIIELHPGIVEKYKRMVENLQAHIDNIDDTASRNQIFAEIRSMIDKVIITPTGERKPVKIEIEGTLATLLNLSNKCGVQVVAGVRNSQPPTLLISA